ncbi:MAG: DUF4298 domain-containing protein [Clostridiaceae bacterium]
MTETSKERMLVAQDMYEKIKEDNEKLREFKESLTGITERMDEMLKYYETQWMEDMEELYKKGESIEVMGEDPIYNELVDQDIVIKEILLKCAEYINR